MNRITDIKEKLTARERIAVSSADTERLTGGLSLSMLSTSLLWVVR